MTPHSFSDETNTGAPETKDASAITPKDVMRGQRAEEAGPQTGDWYWVDQRDYHNKDPEARKTVLMVVERVRSNHVVFHRDTESSTSVEHVRTEDMLRLTRPEPAWRKIIMDQLAANQQAIQDASRALMENAIAKNALPSTAEPAGGTTKTGLELSLHVTDPIRQKADMLAIREQAKEVDKEIAQLAKESAVLCKCLLASDLMRQKENSRQLMVVEDKIFTIEVYAGLQEEVRQIAVGQPAGIGERIAVRQSMLYMDEETLIDYKTGGLDFDGLKDFDAWIVRPENLNRCLPEARGIVAWRIRRKEKDYGPLKSLQMAFAHMKWQSEDFSTYLLIRNGGNVYRIASGVEFSPRLLPLRTEFDGVMQKRTQEDGICWPPKPKNEIRYVPVTPSDLIYDDKVEELRRKLHHYNRILVLIQGLLDRSEVFHPHPIINLSKANSVDEWINAIRDEEDVVLWEGANWREYLAQNRATLKKGDYIYCGQVDTGYTYARTMKARPVILPIDRVRPATEADRENYVRYNKKITEEYSDKAHGPSKVRVPEVGEPGVEVSWYRIKFAHDAEGKWGEVPIERRRRTWLPACRLINLSTYVPGDFKVFLADRRQKEEYLLWTKYFLRAEDWQHDRRAGVPLPQEGDIPVADRQAWREDDEEWQ